MNHKTEEIPKYQGILDQLLQTIEKRDGRKPEELAVQHKAEAEEGMYREAVLQVIAKERLKYRIRFLLLYPELVIPYLLRVKKRTL